MAWYHDTQKTTHTAHDKDAATAQREERDAAARSWVVHETTTAPERVAVGRAITKGLVTAGAGLLEGRPRKGGKVTVRHVRTAGSHESRDA